MIFSPVNVTGPAHRGPQLAQLAQQAAQNVMRRQRMRSMLKTSAGAARGATPGGGQGLMTAQRGVHTVLSQHAPTMPNQGLLSMLGGGSNTPALDTSGMYNTGGGGADFSSIPDPTDPSQSPASVIPQPPGGPITKLDIPPQGGPASYLPIPGSLGNGGANGGGSLFVPNGSSAPSGSGGSGLIPLNGGLFYDPDTDSVVGGGGVGKGAVAS